MHDYSDYVIDTGSYVIDTGKYHSTTISVSNKVAPTLEDGLDMLLRNVVSTREEHRIHPSLLVNSKYFEILYNNTNMEDGEVVITPESAEIVLDSIAMSEL